MSGGLELLQRWGSWLQLTERTSAQTAHDYRVAMVRFVADYLLVEGRPGSLTVVTEDDILAYFDTLPAQGGARMTFLRAAKSFYEKWAYPRGYTATNPVAAFRVRREGRRPVKFFDAEELAAFFAAAGDIPDRRALPTCLLMFGTAARIGSVVAAMPEDVDLERRTIWWREVKGGPSKRYTSPLDEGHSLPAARALLDLAAQRWHPKFGTHNGTLVGVGHETVRKWVRQAGDAAGLPANKSVPHTLRRSMATLMAQSGVQPAEFQRVMNHAGIQEYSRYVGTTDERIRAAVAAVKLPEPSSGGGGATFDPERPSSGMNARSARPVRT